MIAFINESTTYTEVGTLAGAKSLSSLEVEPDLGTVGERQLVVASVLALFIIRITYFCAVLWRVEGH